MPRYLKGSATLSTAIAALLLLLPRPAAAEPSCEAFMPESPSDAQGFTFIGTVTGIGPEHVGGSRWLFFTVEYVLADHGLPNTGNNMILRAGEPVKLLDQGCDRPYGFAVGRRYLYSTSELDDTHAGKMVAWELNGLQARVLVTYPQNFPGNAAPFAAATTLAEAVKLIAPGATLPPTTTVPVAVETGSPSEQTLSTFFLGAAAAIGLYLGRRLRNRTTLL
jgi:hypothetical protein